jgi:hypothetical protein
VCYPCSQLYEGRRGIAETAKGNRWWMENSPERQLLREQMGAKAQQEIRSELKSRRAPIGMGRSKTGAIKNAVMGALGNAMFVFGLAMSLVRSVGEGCKWGGGGSAANLRGCMCFKPNAIKRRSTCSTTTHHRACLAATKTRPFLTTKAR